MTSVARSTAIPCLVFRDAPAAIDWLCHVFGFHRGLVVPGKDGVVVHAELSLGGGMLMLGSRAKDGLYAEHMRMPDEVGGLQTQATYLVLQDVDAAHDRAVASGARIVRELRDEGHGGRGFSCIDPEGHLWSVGSYDPWAATEGH